MENNGKITSYEDALVYFDDIDNIDDLKGKVGLWLIQNEKVFCNNMKTMTYSELYSTTYYFPNKITLNYINFCINIINGRKDIEKDLTNVELLSIDKLITTHKNGVVSNNRSSKENDEEMEEGGDKYIFYNVVGEYNEFSNEFFLLTTFINDEEEANTFVEKYKRYNKFVKVHIVKSYVQETIEYPIYIKENYNIKPNQITYRSFLKNFLNKNDEQIAYLEKSFDEDASRYIEFKKYDMEVDAGIFYSVMKYARDAYGNIDDNVIIEKIRSTLCPSITGKRKKSEKLEGPLFLRHTRNNKDKKYIHDSDEEKSEEGDRLSDKEDIDDVVIDEVDDGIIPNVHKMNSKIKVTLEDMKKRLMKIYKYNVSRDDLMKELVNISEKHEGYCSLVKMLVCYNIYLHRKHYINKEKYDKSNSNNITAPILIGVPQEEIDNPEVEYMNPFGIMYDSVKECEVKIAPYGYKNHTTCSGEPIPKIRCSRNE
tara:strand:- start:1050 stop:2495 length:1446 start_codon:yes stop_codon:yes gene_type:complete